MAPVIPAWPQAYLQETQCRHRRLQERCHAAVALLDRSSPGG